MNDRDAAKLRHPSALPPMRVWSPQFFLNYTLFPSRMARTVPDTFAFVERLGERSMTTVRFRTERFVPVPMSPRVTSADWAALDALLGGAA